MDSLLLRTDDDGRSVDSPGGSDREGDTRGAGGEGVTLRSEPELIFNGGSDLASFLGSVSR
ncbi:unnamed protein product [Haemonchus placei]|uniref:Uncharacterized protein n=1 Tax=Haemonchus placei TaxID=6290 RepID=A0A3P7ZJY1_HAEPC|nr:unnamed protein product [Haemonchus placei]